MISILKKPFILFLFFAFSFNANAQNEEYATFISKADSLYQAKDYKNSGLAYSNAFKALGWKGYIMDRYNAACSWALANVPDSAFYQLNKVLSNSKGNELSSISSDPDLMSLQSDARWNVLMEDWKKLREKIEKNWDRPLVARLDSIYRDDQEGRQRIGEVSDKYGYDSKEIKDLWKEIVEKDSLNLIKVTAILDTRGWLGEDVIGQQGNTALFLVIQHADITTQVKYLPMMREAVKNGRANASSLALLEDRVALRQGKMQIYGSQVGTDNNTGLHYVFPMEDPDNVDKRRAEVGLEPLADYVSEYEIVWDVEQYKKNLPKYIEMAKEVFPKNK